MGSKRFSVVIGSLFWCVLLAGGLWFLVIPMPDASQPSSGFEDESGLANTNAAFVGQLIRYWIRPRQTIELQLPEVPAQDGDPIFVLGPDNGWIQAGYLIDTDSRLSARKATAVWYAPVYEPSDCRFEYHSNRGKFEDVMRLLLPPEKRERVEEIIRESLDANGQEIVDAVRPIIIRSMRESLPIVERALRQAIADHREELEAIGERYRQTVLDERLVPLLKDEVLPTVKHHAEPLAEEIGQKLWDRASVWRFGWRFLYDRTPLPERDLVRREWDRFVNEEAIPVLESHTADMLEVQKNIIRDLSRNQQIRNELSSVTNEIAKDKELQRLVTVILRESIVENGELRQVWLDNWQSEDARDAYRLVGDRLEPVVREIGDELFGTRETGISPSFARVLRNQILGKDKRWLVAVPQMPQFETASQVSNGLTSDSGTLVAVEPFEVVVGDGNMAFPLIIVAGKDESLKDESVDE